MKAKVRMCMGLIMSVGFFGLITVLILKPVPQPNADIIKVLVGFIGGAFVTMMSFYFGDSEGK
ncbi:unnamed protein product [marine sediment metagenome]|uniref:Uncharacterized protein n=1 Tax=marine sediment metagenome TaxID=412755 RepID=X0UNY1_9ZZZZ